MKYSYYPGCSLEHTSSMYDKSARAVFESLGAELIEIDDWNCCGATAYMSVEELLSLSISARNLAIAEGVGLDLVTPCSGCYVTLNKAHHYYLEFPDLKEKMDEALAAAGLRYRGNLKIRHLLDPLINDIGFDKIREAVVKPLKGLKVAPYYGCQIVRPFSEFDDPFHPTLMDDLLDVIGTEVVPFEYKTRCCGGAQMGTNQDLALKMVKDIIECALEGGAEVICTTCPLCQMNLEAYQSKLRKQLDRDFSLPVVYFTQLVAQAMDLPDSIILWKKHLEPIANKLTTIEA